MTEFSGLWTTSGTPSGDQQVSYSQAQLSTMNDVLASCAGFEGVAPGFLNELAPSDGGANTCSIATGGAIVDGKFYQNDASLNITIPSSAGGTTRIDRVVLRANWSGFEVALTRIAGTDSGSPTVPSITQTAGTTYDIKIAQVLVDSSGNLTVTDERVWAAAKVDDSTIGNTNGTLAVKTSGIGSTQIASGAVTNAKLATDSVTNVKVANNAIDTNEIVDLAITSAKIDSSAVTEAKIASSAVTSGKIGTGAVIEAKIGTGAVTNTKLGSSSVSEAKIATNAVTTTKIADSNVTAAKIANRTRKVYAPVFGFYNGSGVSMGSSGLSISGTALTTSIYGQVILPADFSGSTVDLIWVLYTPFTHTGAPRIITNLYSGDHNEAETTSSETFNSSISTTTLYRYHLQGGTAMAVTGTGGSVLKFSFERTANLSADTYNNLFYLYGAIISYTADS